MASITTQPACARKINSISAATIFFPEWGSKKESGLSGQKSKFSDRGQQKATDWKSDRKSSKNISMAADGRPEETNGCRRRLPFESLTVAASFSIIHFRAMERQQLYRTVLYWTYLGRRYSEIQEKNPTKARVRWLRAGSVLIPFTKERQHIWPPPPPPQATNKRQWPPHTKNHREPIKKYEDNRARAEHSGIVSASAIPRRIFRNGIRTPKGKRISEYL